MPKRLTILAVDDTSIQLALIECYLTSLNSPYELNTASGGHAAWKMLSGTPDRYDLVLLDRNMPDMDGLEVLKLMRQHEILKNIPVILQTANTEEEDIREAVRAGTPYYLTKPFTKESMLAIIDSALKNQ
ncbi:MAG: response regulator [Gammaproteobacteria bacterium]|nr:response regulator [Gammaproteobacteria bacterium]